MNLPKEILDKQKELVSLCSKYNVNRLYIFGSASTGNFSPTQSDVDIYVELNKLSPVERGETLMKLWDDLELLFKRKVDLLTDKSLKNPFLKKSIKETQILIYDRAS
jgi:predicted nucleotidyltransferase